MKQHIKTPPDIQAVDIRNCQVRRRRLGITECMTMVTCSWAERTFDKMRLCKHPAAKQITSYRDPA